jgi:lipoprotein-releasing system permease protein
MSEYDNAMVFMPSRRLRPGFNRVGDVTAIGSTRTILTGSTVIASGTGRRATADFHDRLAAARATFFNALQVERNVMF